MRAFLFPGQGSQTVGMGAALSDASRAARDVFVTVDEALGQNLSRLMRDGPEDELKLTENAQPAIMANAIAVFETLVRDGKLNFTNIAHMAAGHSLGEYSALCAAGSLDLSTCTKLLRTRGTAMQQAVPVGIGAMAALLGADLDTARRIAAAAAEGEVCEVANDNDPSQVVISGHLGAITRAIAIAKEMGAKRAIQLPVSAPFHCSLMKPAAEAMADALAKTSSCVRRCRSTPTSPPRPTAIPTSSAPSWSSRSPEWSAGARRSPTWRRRGSRSSSNWVARCWGRWSSGSRPMRG
jgi:[acyl-carrier-protein] S-malonyltransferase